ncbi:MAG: acyltransferase [Bacteroidales bacterium]|nr:acyltransferase [Bacteroidales bacterium]
MARIQGFDIHPTVILERKLHLDRLYPAGVHIGEHTLIASGVTILSHDHCKRVNGQPLLIDTYIGKRCFVAVNATIMPGVHVGDEVIVGAGAVVTKNVPSNAIVAGNPARIIRENIRMNDRAELINWQNGQWTE